MEIKLLSYNIHKGNSFFTRKNVASKIKQFILEQHIDIAFLQEIRGNHHSDYNKYGITQIELFNEHFKHFAYGKNCIHLNGIGNHGNAIFSKYPIIHQQNHNITVNNLEKRGVLYATININNTKIHLISTHLNLFFKDRKKQLILLDEFINENISSNEPIILAGDFNDFNGYIEKELTKKGFIENNEHNTFPSIFPILKLDKIFLKNIETRTYHQTNNERLYFLSDHIPIILTAKI